jgi:putative DNA primase/helicase
MTKITAIAPGGKCPQWNKFLKRVTNNNLELEKFLQRMSGYAITGITRDHALFFLYGLGANGKSVFLSTVAGILGEYHKVAPIETFTASNTDRHPTELAVLRGARLVTAIETEEGRRWAESRIKALTGGDKISARFMRQDFFEFAPQFKLMIAGNHRPGLRSVDEAIKRRMNLVPFAVTIPDAERDRELVEKLKTEWPGILTWMIEGCLAWQKDGLAPPQVVTAATRDYLESEDTLKAWLEDCCIVSPSEWTPVGRLFDSWAGYAEASGEQAGTKRGFSQRLEAHGFKPVRRDDRGFSGLAVNKKWQGGGPL